MSIHRWHNAPFFNTIKWDFLTWVLYLFVSALSCTVKFILHMMNDSVSTDVQQLQIRKKDVQNGNCATVHETGVSFDDCTYRNDNVAWYQKIHWVLYNISLPLEIGIAALYWFPLYNPAENNSISGCNFNQHFAPAVIAVADVWISGIVLHIYHFYWISLFGLWYSWRYPVGGVDQFGDSYPYSILYYGCIPFCILYLISLPRRWLSSRLHKSCYKE